jgi:hypothetical protein
MSYFAINWFYGLCFLVSVLCTFAVMWHRIPTGTSGTVGFTLIALVSGATATDWLNASMPYITFKRSILLWVGLLFLAQWVLSTPWEEKHSFFWRGRKSDRSQLARGYQPIADPEKQTQPPPQKR